MAISSYVHVDYPNTGTASDFTYTYFPLPICDHSHCQHCWHYCPNCGNWYCCKCKVEQLHNCWDYPYTTSYDYEERY